DLVRGGDPAAAAHALGARRIEVPFHFGTARDERLFRDFSAGVPERVNTELAAYSSGEKDPGSLRRAIANAGTHTPNSYNEFFPPSSPPDPHAPSAGGLGPRGRGDGTAKPSARSYARVRFSGRIGGVVFGRPA